jgi:DNA-binding transcriptional ArsR family regulator
MSSSHRSIKDTLYEQVARIGKALSSPKRLELLEMLAQSDKTVETLAAELSIDVKLTSAHLKALKEARLVQSRRDGKYIIYRLSGPDVANLGVTLREVAEEHLVELRICSRRRVGVRWSSSTCDRSRSTTPRTCLARVRCPWPSWSVAWLNCPRRHRSSLTAAGRSA